MMKPWDIIKELESDNSRLKKEAIIRRESDAENIRFFNGVGACLDGFRTFGIQKVPESKKDGPGLTQEQFEHILARLEERTLTGNEMREAVAKMCLTATMDEWNYW